jgi:hypothetical protein
MASGRCCDEFGRVLAVAVHRQHVREAGGIGPLQAVQHSRALALVLRQHLHAQQRVGRGQGLQARGRAVGAAVDHHPHRRPLRARRAHRGVNLLAGVVAGDQHQVGAAGGGRRRGHGDGARTPARR